MREPRCGNKDLRRIQRRKRYILQGISNRNYSYSFLIEKNFFFNRKSLAIE